MASEKRIYTFVKGESDGGKDMKQLLGGKGANLCELARLGVRVPPGLTIPTTVCQEYHDPRAPNSKSLPGWLMPLVFEAIERQIEPAAGGGRRFGSADNPLLLSVRSGAALSMPGMMDTVLDLGLNDAIVEGLAKRTNERFAYDCYRRLWQMYGDVVLGIDHALFEAELSAAKKAAGVLSDVDLSADHLKDLVSRYRAVYKAAGKALPTDPREQLREGVDAVFRSWMTPRAVKYREIKHIRGLWGTAVNVQAMVFGNMDARSGSGVLFTRNPVDGADEIFGEYLLQAQGEEVVAGTRTPAPLKELARVMPAIYEELHRTVKGMERDFGDAQDVEITIERGVLWILQTRNGKRTGRAALRIALDMAREGLVSEDDAVMMVEPGHLDQLLHPVFADAGACAKGVIARGLAASPGAAVGRLVFSSADAEAWAKKGERVILVRHETSAEDVGGMHSAQAVLTAAGGMTSHAAVVARGWGKPCVCGCAALEVDAAAKTLSVARSWAAGNGSGNGSGSRSADNGNDGNKGNNGNGPGHDAPTDVVVLREGDWLSVDGTTGDVILGQMAVRPPAVSGDLAAFLALADARRRLKVYANADTPEDSAVARANGAEGVGLVRTEHCFFATPERIAAVRRLIVGLELGCEATSSSALAEVEAFQTADFQGIFEAMEGGLPVTVRCLDPPLGEFLPAGGSPQLRALCERLAGELPGRPCAEDVERRLAGLHEVNPMMGLRGCRLGVVYPELTRMQARAIARGALAAAAKSAAKAAPPPSPHVMIPLVAFLGEWRSQAALVREEMSRELAGSGIVFKVGTMIEIPRAALIAGELAAPGGGGGGGEGDGAGEDGAAFFSFGSNDLTQMTCGLSRDDAQAKFLQHYLDAGVLPVDPFAELDPAVGELVRLAAERGRAARPGLEVGVCGEHGGDPKSIAFFEEVGLDYVSCSPLRVPIARLAAAQAALALKKKKGKAAKAA